MKEIYINPRQLNINTILKKQILNVRNGKNYQNNTKNANSDIIVINNILNNNSGQIANTQSITNNKYNIIKYLGEGIQGSLYLAKDNQKKRYICKKIILDTNNIDQLKQIELELNILKYLSENNITKEHINHCVDHKIIDNNIFTIFPIFDGYSLNHLTKYLRKLDNNSYYRITFHLIKTILHGMAKIHQSKIAHQNINNNSILVSTYTNPKEINVKFTDFALGCGNNMGNTGNMGNMVNIDDYDKGYTKSNIKFNNCKINNYSPVNITEDIMTELVDSDFLNISQKYDLLCLGFVFVQLLLFFDNINIDFKKGYNKANMQYILELLNNKYLSKVENSDTIDYKRLFPFLNVNEQLKKDIIEYIKLIREYILCKTAKRQTCQYVLDKIIIYEKYKNEVF